MHTTMRMHRTTCDDRGKLHPQPDVVVGALKNPDNLTVVGRYLREHYGVRYSVSSTSSADYVAPHVMRVWMSVSDPDGGLFESLVFSFLARTTPKFTVGQRVKVRWSGRHAGIVQDVPVGREGEVIELYSSWPKVIVQFDGAAYPVPIRHTHVVDVNDPIRY